MTELDYLHFINQDAFHHWLLDNHDKSPGIWMVFYKKHTKTPCVDYDNALDEALCFGWIDSIIKRIDEDKYARKFTPRTDITKWSDINRRKITALIKSGRMNEAGLRKIDSYLKTGNVDWGIVPAVEKAKAEIEIPGFMLKSFSENEPALTNFNKMPASFKRQYILWVTNAKKAETTRKRLEESIGLLKKNKPLGLK